MFPEGWEGGSGTDEPCDTLNLLLTPDTAYWLPEVFYDLQQVVNGSDLKELLVLMTFNDPVHQFLLLQHPKVLNGGISGGGSEVSIGLLEEGILELDADEV